MVLPRLSDQEKSEALKKAQLMRKRRNQIRQQLKSGQRTLRDVLQKADDEALARMRVAYLIESLPRIGKLKARKIMEDIGIDKSRRVQGLGSRQREALLERLAKK